MATEIEREVTKFDLDSSGFLKGAQEVLKAIDKLEDALKFKNVSKGVNSILNAMASIKSAVSASANNVANIVENTSRKIFSSTTEAANSVSNYVSRIASECQNAASAIETSLLPATEKVQSALGGVVTAIESNGNRIGASINNASSLSQTAVGAAVAGIIAKIASIAKVTAIVAAVGVAIGVAVSLAVNKIRETVGKTVNGIHMTVTEKVNAVKGAITGSLGEIGKIIFDKSASISDKIRDIGAAIVWNVGKACVAVADAIRPTIEGIFRALEIAFPQTTALFKEGFAKIGESVKTSMMAVYTSVTTTMQKVIDSVKEKFQKIADAVNELADKLGLPFRKQKEEAQQATEALGKFGNSLENIRGPISSFDSDAAKLKATLDGLFGDGAADAGDYAAAADKAATATAEMAEAAADAGSKANEAYKDAAKSAEDAAEATEETGDAAKDSGEGFEDLGKNAGEAFEETEDGAKDASSGLNGLLGILNKFAGGLGHDLGELPFKLKEIKDASPVVGMAMSFAFSKAGEKVAEYIKGLKEAKDEADSSKNGIGALGGAVEAVTGKFSALGIMAKRALENITDKAMAAGEKLIKSLSVDQISAGWDEYGLKINSTQTIMASTGESLSTVNGYLEELNKYADKTIYSFSDMTANIGKFTNAGVDLDTAVAAIKGISNEAALSGANAQEASRAMYNFAQAISSGSVKLIDWKSIENANMATKGFKEQLIETAVELKKVKKVGDQYVSLTKDANGHTSDAFTATKNFNNSLSAQWMTTEVLTKTLAKYSDETTDFGKKAYAAAQDIKTGKQLLDTMQEAVGSGWSMTFELIIGDFEEAKKFWTGINNLVSPILDGISNARNGLLQGWKALGGRDELISGLKDSFTNLVDILKAAKKGFETFMPPITAERLKDVTDKIKNFLGQLKLSDEQIAKVKDIFTKLGDAINTVKGAFGEIRDRVAAVFGDDLISSGISRIIGFAGTLAEKVREFAKSKIAKTIHDNIHKIGSVISNVRDLLSRLWDNVKSIASSVGGVLSGVGSTVSDKFGKVLDFINGSISFVKGAIDAVATFIRIKLGTAEKWLPKLLSVAMNVLGAIGKILQKVGGYLSEHAEGIGRLVRAFLALKSVTGFVKNGLINIAAAGVKLFTTIGNLKTGIDFFMEKGPKLLKLFGKLGGKAGAKGLAEGAASGASGLLGLSSSAVAAAGAIAGVVAATVGAIYILAKLDEKDSERIRTLYGLTEAQKAENEALKESVEAYDESTRAKKESLDHVDSEFNYYQKLTEELKTLVDENGKVKEGYESRVNTIISILNEQLGTELSVTDGIISGYQNEIDKIDELIEKKRSLAKLNAASEYYDKAIVEKDQTDREFQDKSYELKQAEEEWKKSVRIRDELGRAVGYEESTGQLIEDLSYFTEETQAFLKDHGMLFNDGSIKLGKALIEASKVAQTDENDLTSATEAYNNASKLYYENLATIKNYEALDAATTEGNAEKMEQAATKLYNNFLSADTATVDMLKQQISSYKQEYDHILALYNDGAAGVTQDMVDKAAWLVSEAENEYNAAIAETRKTAQTQSKEAQAEAIEAQKASNQAAAEAKKAQKEAEEAKKARDQTKPGEARADSNLSAAADRAAAESERVSRIVAPIRKAADEGQKALDDFGRHGEAKAEKAMSDINEAIATGTAVIKEKAPIESNKAGNAVAKELIAGVDEADIYTKLERNGWWGALGLGNGLYRGAEYVRTAAQYLSSLIPKTTASTLDESSPSKLADQQGGYWGEGLVNGMERMERAVKNESRTLSETLIDGAGSPMSSIGDILSGDFTDVVTITPVLDLSNIQNGGSMISDILSGQQSIGLGQYDVSGLFPKPTPAEKTADPTLAELQGLRQDMAKFNERLTRLQVVMDNGRLVGELIDPMDYELGRRAAAGQRG